MKCPICKRYFASKREVLLHMDGRHFTEIPKSMSATKYYFALNHGGETTGKCRICSDHTLLDERTGRTLVLCGNPKCKDQFAKNAQASNMKKFGVPHLLNDQNHQMMMLSKRKISGNYLWSDGVTSVPYVGSYELRFLEFLDHFLDFNPSTIYAPCPFTIYYEYDGETLSHTADFYIDILDLVVEVKHGGSNPNTHPKFQAVDIPKDKAKEHAMRVKTDHNYIKITDNDFRPFLALLFKLTENDQVGTKERLFVINESSQEIQSTLLTEADDSLDLWMHDMTTTAEKMFGQKEPVDLYFHFFGHITKTFVGAISLTITLEDNLDKMIQFVDGKFEYMKKSDGASLSKTIATTYKYIGELSLDKEIALLKKLIEDKTQIHEINETNAIVKVFKILFDKKESYTLFDIALNPDFIKYRKYTEAERNVTDFDSDLANLFT